MARFISLFSAEIVIHGPFTITGESRTYVTAKGSAFSRSPKRAVELAQKAADKHECAQTFGGGVDFEVVKWVKLFRNGKMIFEKEVW